MSDIIGSKGADKEHVHYEAPDSLHSTSYARVLDLVSEGEILGLTNGLQSIFLNGTPVQNADNSNNFTGVNVDFRTGTQTQDYIPGFPSVENEVGVGVELKYGTPWVHAISNTSLSAIRIIMGVPALSQSDTTNGDIKGYKVDYKIELSKDNGAYATVLTSSFNGKTTTAYQRSTRIDLPAATTGWSIRATRLTTNANTNAIADTTTIVSYTDVIDAKLRYPMSAIVGLQVDAKQFQNVPTRAYDLMGRIVQVPSNYNAKTRVYTGTWDGTFKPSWTDNPAWIFRDLALNDRYGLGHRITAAQIDKWALYTIARYCDGLVPDGKGGTEPRFTCNLYLQTQKQAYTVLQDLASIFRGISYWGAGSIIASADMPTDPVYVYTAANVIGGKFARVGSSKKTRFTTALVSWNDPADMYKAKVEYTEDAEGITRYGIQQVSLTAFGCASQGQAQRVGRWALATSRLETEMISFDVGMDGAIALPGQIVRVADPARMGRRNGGRIKAATGRVVVLDKAPVINAGDKLTVVLPTGKSETRVVASVAADSVTVTADWTIVPAAQSVWSVDSTTLIAPTYKVRSVTEKDATTFTISLTQHEPGKFDFIENGTAITPRPQTAINAAVQQPPASVTVVGYTVSLQDVQKLGFTATCPAVDGAVAYEGAFQHDNSNWFTLPRQPGPVFDVLDVLAGYYTVKVAAVNALGITSIETLSTSTLVNKNANPKNAGILLTPSAPGFNVNADSSITPASITVHADLLALDGFVTWSAVGATITSSNNNATIVATNMPGAAMTLTATIIALGQTFTRSIDIVKSADGAAGASNYTWVKYATSATGTGLTDNPAGMTYIGFAFNRSSPVESTVATDYTWSSVTGPAGTSTFTGVVYLQQLAQPSTPTGGTFNFTTSALTPPASWSASQPTSSSVPTWAVRFTFTAATLGATVTAGTWSTPTNISQNGTNGSPGIQSMVVFLYQYNSATPAAPNGTSTLNWVTGANSSYNGTDSWATVAPANPGTPGLRLYVATQPVTAAGGTTSTPAISYANAGISAWSQNGNNGANGAQSATATVYQSAVTIPAGPVGSNTFTWSTGLFGAAPPNWSLAPGAPVPGSTRWAATVRLVDTAVAATTGFNWSAASITAQGYDGGNGTIGVDGLSYVTAYVATTVGTASTAPAPTTGKTSVPAANSSGLPGTPQSTVPTLTAGQYMMQFDGSYNKSTDTITWSIPYQASLKVGSLSAITTNTGALTVTGDFTSANGLFKVDANGKVTMRSQETYSADGQLLFSTGTGLTLAGGRVADVSNLIKKGTFDDGSSGGWNGFAVEAIGGTASAAVPATKHFVTQSRDCTEIGNQIPVTPGETLYFSAWINTEATNFDCSFGIFIYNKNGTTDVNNIVQFASAVAVSKGSAWTFVQGSIVVAAGGAVGIPWLFQNGTDFVALNRARYAALWAGRAQRGATVGAPAGTFVAGVAAATVATAANNFNTSNDRNGAAVVAPTVPTDGTAVDHTIRTDGAADVSFEWAWSGAEGDIDGFLVYVYRSPAGGAYTFGTSSAEEQVYTVPASKRAFIQFGTGANVYITFGVQAYRAVDKDINAAGVIKSAIVKSALAAENPYQPSTSVAFVGNVTGTINNIPATSVNVWSAVSGTGKPQDNATVGATLGTNVSGQITAGNSPSLVGPNAITNSQFGGDLLSTNYVAGASGWALSRAGNLYANSVYLRGAVMGGSYTGYSNPPSGQGGFYIGSEGAAWGNFNDGRYVLIDATGDIHAPGFELVNKQLTTVNQILIAPKIGDGMTASMSPTFYNLVRAANVQFTNAYAGNFTASAGGGASASLAYSWTTNSENSAVSVNLSSTSGASAIVYVTGKLLAGQEVNVTVTCRVTDLNNGVSRDCSANINIQVS